MGIRCNSARKTRPILRSRDRGLRASDQLAGRRGLRVEFAEDDFQQEDWLLRVASSSHRGPIRRSECYLVALEKEIEKAWKL
jgi:hypothetical protein